MPPRDPRRVDRVAEAVREEVAAFLARDAKDPRITAFVTVTAVEMTRDLRHANVFVSVMGGDEERAATFEGLKSVAHHLRSHVGRALRLQFAPEIVFKLDQSVARAARIETLLASIKDGRATDPDGGTEPGPADKKPDEPHD
jgi:ribosome-binding factor A